VSLALANAVQGHLDGTAKLHRYWTAGPGLAKWLHSPHPWQALHDHLAEYIHDPDKLNRTTSAWHNELLKPTGSDEYRVEHGGKARGKKIGPG
jgi:hypothetical protein